MKPTFIISLLLFSFIATCTTLAQHSTYHISGRVTDTEGEPLPGATISIKGKGTGAVIHYNSPEPVHTSSPPRM